MFWLRNKKIIISYTLLCGGLDAFYENCTNGSALLNKGAARALDKKYLPEPSPEPVVQNQNNFTEMVLMLPSTKTDQKVQLG